MSLIQIPKIEYITLEQFIPNWTEMIEEMDEKEMIFDERENLYENRGIHFVNCNQCLVGEAHHYTDDYSSNISGKPLCYQCERFCTQPAKQAIRKGKETFQTFKLDLFTHMLEAHPQLMIK